MSELCPHCAKLMEDNELLNKLYDQLVNITEVQEKLTTITVKENTELKEENERLKREETELEDKIDELTKQVHEAYDAGKLNAEQEIDQLKEKLKKFEDAVNTLGS